MVYLRGCDMKKVINPRKYELLLKGQAPCNYSLNSHTLYRSLQRPDWMTTVNQIEAFYKYDYDTFAIDYAFRTFETDDPRVYSIIMVTDKGIYKEDVSRSLMDTEIHMRWTVFVTKIADVRKGLIVSTDYNSFRLTWFYPKCACDVPEDKSKIKIMDDCGKFHIMDKSPLLLDALKKGNRYVEVPAQCYIRVTDFRMWYTVF